MPVFESKNDLFISYSHGDSECAKLLYYSLRVGGVKCWMDFLMAPGTKLSEEIKTQIRSSRAFALLASEDSLQKPYVRAEKQFALDCKLPRVFDIALEYLAPEKLYGATPELTAKGKLPKEGEEGDWLSVELYPFTASHFRSKVIELLQALTEPVSARAGESGIEDFTKLAADAGIDLSSFLSVSQPSQELLLFEVITNEVYSRPATIALIKKLSGSLGDEYSANATNLLDLWSKHFPLNASPTQEWVSANWIGRESEATEIDRFLSCKDELLLILCGQSGIGKSALASRAFHGVCDSSCYGGLSDAFSRFDAAVYLGRDELLRSFYHTFTDQLSWVEGMLHSFKGLDPGRVGERKALASFDWMFENLLTKYRILIVLDNFETALSGKVQTHISAKKFLERMVAQSSLSKVLVTTRVNPQLQVPVRARNRICLLDLDDHPLSDLEAVNMLSSELGLGENFSEGSAGAEALHLIVETCLKIPQNIIHVAAYIKSARLTPKTFTERGDFVEVCYGPQTALLRSLKTSDRFLAAAVSIMGESSQEQLTSIVTQAAGKPAALEGALSRLLSNHIIRFDGQRYSVHALVRDVVLSKMNPAERARLYSKAADWYSDEASVAATGFESALLSKQAARLLIEAERPADAFAKLAVVGDDLDLMVQHRDLLEIRTSLRRKLHGSDLVANEIKLAEIQYQLDDFRTAERTAIRLMDEMEKNDSQGTESYGDARMLRANMAYEHGRCALAARLAWKSYKTFKNSSNWAKACNAVSTMIIANTTMGNYRRAQFLGDLAGELLENARGHLSQAAHASELSRLNLNLAASKFYLRGPDFAIGIGESAREGCPTICKQQRAYTCLALANYLLAKGDLDGASRNLEACRFHKEDWFQFNFRQADAGHLVATGNFDAAIGMLESNLKDVLKNKTDIWLPLDTRINLACARAAAGNAAGAQAGFIQTMVGCEEDNYRLGRAYCAYRLLGMGFEDLEQEEINAAKWIASLRSSVLQSLRHYFPPFIGIIYSSPKLLSSSMDSSVLSLRLAG
jgi:hypothetical protein